MPPIDNSDLEGPEIDRRTTLKLFGAAGMSAFLAGCAGGGGDDTATDDGSPGGDTTGDGSDSTEQPSGSARMGGTIKAGLSTDNLRYLDPHYIDKAPQMTIVSNVFNGLLKVGEGNEIVGDLAKDWKIPDNTTYVFTLHEGVTFHNGDPLKAEQVKWSIERLKAAKDSEHRGKVMTVESVEATGEYEVTFNMKKPTAPFLAFMTCIPGRAGAIVHKSAAKDPQAYNQKPIGSGPFKVESREAGESCKTVKHEGYWETDDEGNQLPYFDGVTWNLVPEPSTMWSAISTNSIQHAALITGPFAQQAERRDNLTVDATSSGDWYCLAPLCNDPAEFPELVAYPTGGRDPTQKWQGRDLPTANPKVRQAISMALNREEIVEKAHFGYAIPAHSAFNPLMGKLYSEHPEPGQYHDPEKAKQLLDEAGYTGDPRFSFNLLGLPEYQRWMTVIQQQLADVGIEMGLDIQQASSYWDVIYNYTHMVTTYGGSTDIDPYMTLWKQLGTPNPENSMGAWQKSCFFNEEFDQALMNSFTTPRPEERLQYLRKAEKIFVEQTAYAMTVFNLKPKVNAGGLTNVGIQAGLSNMHRAYLAE